MTLLGGISGREERDVLQIAQEIVLDMQVNRDALFRVHFSAECPSHTLRHASAAQAFRVKMTRPAAGSMFHQCVFILCEKGEPLTTVAATVRRKFDRDSTLVDYMPHLSLLYADLDDATR